MIEKLDDHTELEIKDNLARVIKNGLAGIWHQFSTEKHPDIMIEVHGPNEAVISYGGKDVVAEISGLDLTFH